MAAGRYILATDVGEARLVLDAAMRVPYQGTVDPEYPARLAQRLKDLCRNRELLEAGRHLPEVAERHFSYDRLSATLHDLFVRILSH